MSNSWAIRFRLTLAVAAVLAYVVAASSGSEQARLPAIALVGALPGLQAHGEYHVPKPEFGGRTGIQVGCDLVRTFGTEWHK